jgi:hypothetical protein
LIEEKSESEPGESSGRREREGRKRGEKERASVGDALGDKSIN